jgi:hypothetical protein
VRRFVTTASLAVAALLGGSPAAIATPMQPLFGQAPSPEYVSARIFPREFGRRAARLPLAVLMRESVADGDAGRSDAIRMAADPGAALPLFHSPVSLTLDRSDVSEALRSIRGPRDLNRGR